MPGYRHDTFSSAHPGFLANPLFSGDELGLIRNGLSYVAGDPTLVLPFPDGESIVVWRDHERTARELGRFSLNDAKRWRELITQWRSMAPLHIARVGRAPGAHQEVPDVDAEAAYRALEGQSCWDFVHANFESDHARALMLWFGLITVAPVDRTGTALFPAAMPSVFGRF